MNLIVFTVVIERVVHVDAHSFDWGQFHRDRVPKVILVGEPATAIFKDSRKIGKVTLSCPVAVRMFHRHDRTGITSHKVITMYIVLIQSSQFGAVKTCLHREV